MFAATMLCLATLTQAPRDWPDAFRGVLVEKGTDRPLAGVSIRVDSMADLPTTVTTDAQGRFDGLPMPRGSYVAVRANTGPSLRIRAEDDRAWPWTAGDGEGKLSDYQQRQVIEAVYEQRIESRWKGKGVTATLVAECPPVGVVEAVVRDPEGKPLVDSPIVVTLPPEFPHNAAGPIRFAGRTNATGTFRLRSFEGPRLFDVTVAGVGFGSTGRVEIGAGKTTRAEMPPLARFARIEGRLADSLKGPGAVARVGDLSSYNTSPSFTAACDDEGRFTIADIVPGDYYLSASRGGKRLDTIQRQVPLGPGEVLRNVVLEPNPPTPPEVEKERQRTLQRLNGGDEKRTIAWVEGTVGDERGRPLADATVYARVEYDGGIRAYSDIRKTAADREGRYRIEGPFHRMMGTLSVVVTAKDRPPIVAYAPGPDSRLDPSELKPARLDVAVGAKAGGGALAVKVVRDGRPLPGAAVRLTTAATNQIFAETARSSTPETSGELYAALVPKTAADANGVARFQNLAPDVYEAVATPPADPNQPPRGGSPWGPTTRGVASGIHVLPGGEVEAVAAVVPAPAPARFRILGPDGAPVANRTVAFGWGRGRVTANTGIKTDERGEAERALGPGLWTILVRYRDAELKSFPVTGEPFYEAEESVAVSPAIAFDRPIELRAVRREPGSLKVRLLDLDGAPARGGVMILPLFNRPSQRAGSTDEQGWVRFANMQSGKYWLRGRVDGAPAPVRPRYRGRFTDEDLKDQTVIFDREVTVEADGETVIELRREPAAYVRAAVRAPAGRSTTEYMVSFNAPHLPGRFPTWEVSEDRAGYLFGPAPPGKWPIVVAEITDDLANRGFRSRDVVVEPGAIVHIDLEAPESPKPTAPAATAGRRMASLGMGGIREFATGPDGATMTVVMPDGTTPAFGARALFIPAEGDGPVARATADALGRLTWSGFWRAARAEGEKGPERVKEPTVIARGAGGEGPVVATVKPGEPPRLVLPAANGVSGRVTIAGAAVAGLDAGIRVAIAAEGKGAIDAVMNRSAIADPDGRFRFVGLAPGRYLARAVRDEIWTSKPVPVAVEAEKEAAPIELDIPAPGAAIALRLVGRDGEPVAAAFSINRGGGPIAGRSDERGEAVVRGLAAEVFELVVDGDATPHPLDVPPFRPGAAPLDVRVEVSRRRP